MKGNQLMRKPKLLRALLILLFVAAPILMDPRANRSFNSQDNAWSSDQEH